MLYLTTLFLPVLFLLFAFPALAKKDCQSNACSLHPNTTLGGDAIVKETNSPSTMVGVWTTVQGIADDTGTEVCALVGMECVDVIVVDEVGGAGDELVPSTCATDNSDGVLTLSLCN